MLRVGLTGGIGSGKTLVARMFRVLGAPVFEADAEARRLMQEDRRLVNALRNRFPLVFSEGRLDRKALAGIVFNDGEALKDLNAIVHPAVREAFDHWCGLQKAPYVLMEAAILAETGGNARFDRIIVVSAPEDLRLARVVKRDKADRGAVLARMRNQANEEERLAIADHVIMNDDRSLVIPQVLHVHRELAHS